MMSLQAGVKRGVLRSERKLGGFKTGGGGQGGSASWQPQGLAYSPVGGNSFHSSAIKIMALT